MKKIALVFVALISFSALSQNEPSPILGFWKEGCKEQTADSSPVSTSVLTEYAFSRGGKGVAFEYLYNGVECEGDSIARTTTMFTFKTTQKTNGIVLLELADMVKVPKSSAEQILTMDFEITFSSPAEASGKIVGATYIDEEGKRGTLSEAQSNALPVVELTKWKDAL